MHVTAFWWHLLTVIIPATCKLTTAPASLAGTTALFQTTGHGRMGRERKLQCRNLHRLPKETASTGVVYASLEIKHIFLVIQFLKKLDFSFLTYQESCTMIIDKGLKTNLHVWQYSKLHMPIPSPTTILYEVEPMYKCSL